MTSTSTSTTPRPDAENCQQPRDSHGHFLPFGSIPWALEPDAWDDTCRHSAKPLPTTAA